MRWIFAVILAWLIFVLSLSGWWLYFGLSTLEKFQAGGEALARQQRMLFMEGTVLMASLLIGGLALFYFAYRMYQEKSAKEIFFASFTHDMKTSLFRLQLEIEKLAKVKNTAGAELLLDHTRKMQLDLENSLDGTLGLGKETLIETFDLQEFIQELHAQWPELGVQFKGKARLRADRKALFSIFKNLFHNSYLHAQADEIQLHIQDHQGGLQITYQDNGKAFVGDLQRLGKSQFSVEGSGFGLYIVRQWVEKLGWKVEFRISHTGGLQILMSVPRGSLS